MKQIKVKAIAEAAVHDACRIKRAGLLDDAVDCQSHAIRFNCAQNKSLL